MNTDIFICTYRRDLAYFDQCIRSIAKFATGFRNIAVRIPEGDFVDVLKIMKKHALPCEYGIHPEVDEMGKGMVEHMAAVCRADQYCYGADFILHMDSDCIFTEPVTPDDYIVDSKPVLMYASYAWLASQGHDLSNWKRATDKALGCDSQHEFMRRHPSIHIRDVYPAIRKTIEDHTGKNYKDYIVSTKNDFPWEFSEFVALGQIAWQHFHPMYHWINQETESFPPHKVIQFWSHAPIDQPQDINNGGQKMHCTPLEVCNRILG